MKNLIHIVLTHITFAFIYCTGFANSQEIQTWASADQEKTIAPAHGTQWLPVENSEKTVLIIQGLYESPYYMRNWAAFFNSRNFNVLNLRLPGHFEKAEGSLSRVRAEEWLTAAETAYDLVSKISTEVTILGYSTGGILAAHLALKHPEKVKNIFLISPAFALSDKTLFASTVLNPTGLTSKQICRDRYSLICQVMMNLEPEFKMMVNNNIELAPHAGIEVKNLIDLVFETRIQDMGPNPKLRTSYYGRIMERLNAITAAVAMANSESDTVLDVNFNARWIQSFTGGKLSLNFNSRDKIYHSLMCKNPETQFLYTEMGYNFKYREIEALFDQALAGQ